MWIQFEREDLQRLATLADAAGFAPLARRLQRALRTANVVPEHAAFRDSAREMFGKEGELEIDDDAVVSVGDDNGAYVMSWRWIDGEVARTLRRHLR